MLAVILEEPGADVVADALRSGAAMSAVNVGEVAARLEHDEWSDPEVALIFETLGIGVLSFDREAALLSNRLGTSTRRFGLGLGDGACLATGRITLCPVLTSDRS